MISPETKWAFFGSSNFSVLVLNKLETLGVVPTFIVTTPDKPKGRGLKIVAGEVRAWAEKRNIPVFAPASLKNTNSNNDTTSGATKNVTNDANNDAVSELKKLGAVEVFLIASYGKIVPQEILDIPAHGTLNIHPSLLPKFRGPTPIESSILDENETGNGIGVTIMKVDAEVDHGPIVAQRKVEISEFEALKNWPAYYKDLEKILAEEGASLFAITLSKWIAGEIEATEQNHLDATFTKKFLGQDRLIDLSDSTGNGTQNNLRKIRAFSENRDAYFLTKHGDREIRVIVIKAKIENEMLVIERVKPEGKNEMSYDDFKRGLRE